MPKVPIKNIYFMLCYSWGHLKQLDEKKLDSLTGEDIYDFFSEVLINSIKPLIKRGFDRNYIPQNDDLKVIKGKIDFSNTFRKLSLRTKNTLYCDFEEYHHNILQNQIIKTTIYYLLKIKDLDKEIHKKLKDIYYYFRYIDLIKLDSKIFKNVLFHRNNTIYKFLISICEIIFENLLIDDKAGENYFRSFEDNDRKMATLFEDFVRKYYYYNSKELKIRQVKRDNIKWDLKPYNLSDSEYLPKMETDISLIKGEYKYIIDTKYYKEALSSNNHDKEKITKKLISNHLYQIFSYVNNFDNNNNYKIKGILLYPQNGKHLDLHFNYSNDIDLSIMTIDLNQDHNIIKNRLDNIIDLDIDDINKNNLM